MAKCEGCGESVYRMRYSASAEKMLGIGSGSCHCYEGIVGRELIARTTNTAFAIELDHVHDEFGHKVKVENLRQLSAAEKRYGFQSVVLNSDAQNFDDPPQQRRMDIAAVHNWKFSNRERYERSRGRR